MGENRRVLLRVDGPMPFPSASSVGLPLILRMVSLVSPQSVALDVQVEGLVLSYTLPSPLSVSVSTKKTTERRQT